MYEKVADSDNSFAKINVPEWNLILIGTFISFVGLSIGTMIRRNRIDGWEQ